MESQDDKVEIGTLAEALYDFDGVREDNVPFKKGEILTIIEMDDSGWWKGANAEGRVGIFPYNYCQLRISPDANFPFVKAITDFEGQSDEDLSFSEGDLITVLRQISSDWSEGKTKDGRRGRFPNNFAETTGKFDEETLKEETEKWERIEAEKVAEAERRKKEKEEAEQRLREEAERLKQEEEEQKKKEEEERRKKELEEEKQRLVKEAREAKKLALQLESEKAAREAELRTRQLELEKQLEEKEKQKRDFELSLQQEAEEARRRAEIAEQELQAARAEAAILRKKQAAADARKSVVVRKQIDEENAKIQEKAKATAQKNQGHAPGPPPKLKPKKPKGALQPVYLGKEEAPPEIEVEEVKEQPKKDENRRRRKKGKPINPKFAHLGGGNKCPNCGEGVGVGDQVKALGQVWHSNCFTCATCSKVLRNGEYRDHEGTAYCNSCHSKGFGITGYGYGLGATLKTNTEAGKKATGKVETSSIFANAK